MNTSYIEIIQMENLLEIIKYNQHNDELFYRYEGIHTNYFNFYILINYNTYSQFFFFFLFLSY